MNDEERKAEVERLLTGKAKSLTPRERRAAFIVRAIDKWLEETRPKPKRQIGIILKYFATFLLLLAFWFVAVRMLFRWLFH